MEKNYSFNIKKLCETYHISREELSRCLHVDDSSFDDWQDDVGNIKVEDAKKLAGLLNVSLDKLFFDTKRDPINISSVQDDQEDLDELLKIYLDDQKEIQKTQKKRNIAVNKIDGFGRSSKIRFVRSRVLGYGQEEFGDKIVASRESVEKWELLAAPESMDRYCMISQVSGISLDYLLYDDHPLEISSNRLSEDEYFALYHYGRCIKNKKTH